MAVRADLRAARAVAVNDIRLAVRDRLFLVAGTVIPLNFLLLFMLFALTGGRAPTAIVMHDQGPLARQFVAAMAGAHSFVLHTTDAEQAQREIHEGSIVAVVTIPATFDADLRAGRPVELPVLVNNLNQDFTNDIRRAVPLSITSFYSEAFPGQVVVRAQEVDVQARDTDYIPYLSVSILVIALLVAGLIQGGLSSAREYENGTIKVLLSAPAARWALGLGKVMGVMVSNAVAFLVLLAVLVLLVRVTPQNPLELLGAALVLMVACASFGTLLGVLLRRRQAALPLGMLIALPIFFMSGVFGPPNWQSPGAGALADASPVYYAIAIFQHAFHGFQTSQQSLATDTVVLAGFGLLGLLAAGAAIRRLGVAH
ncbi:MAG: ABC transporter permease [Candidatus Dormibacteraeota bacterium]|nr:ABC transporter permease [Candidatus Dormibacteraeota bacterium]